MSLRNIGSAEIAEVAPLVKSVNLPLEGHVRSPSESRKHATYRFGPLSDIAPHAYSAWEGSRLGASEPRGEPSSDAVVLKVASKLTCICDAQYRVCAYGEVEAGLDERTITRERYA